MEVKEREGQRGERREKGREGRELEGEMMSLHRRQGKERNGRK